MAKKTKVKKLGITRAPGYIYFIDSDGDVSRSKRGVKNSKSKVRRTNIIRQKGFLYFLDGNGDVSRSKMKKR